MLIAGGFRMRTNPSSKYARIHSRSTYSVASSRPFLHSITRPHTTSLCVNKNARPPPPALCKKPSSHARSPCMPASSTTSTTSSIHTNPGRNAQRSRRCTHSARNSARYVRVV